MILCFTFTPGIHWTLIFFFFYAEFQGILFPYSEPINPEPSLKSHSFHYTVPIIINQMILCVCVCPSKFSILFSEWGFLSMDQLPTVLIYNKNSPSMVMDGDLFFLLGHAKPFDLT